MATLKRSQNETSMKNKYDALKELEKGVPQKEVALRFGVQKSTLSTWKVESIDEPVAKPPISEVNKAIEILEKFTLFSRSGEDLMSSLKVVYRVIHAEEQLSKKQSTINAYFRKEK